MGNKGSKNATKRYNFKQYGFTDEEGINLENYFNHAANRHHELNFHEFQKIYSNLHPEVSKNKVGEIAKEAFQIADTNCNGRITFDEFLAFYIMHKSLPNNVIKNLKAFASDYNENKEYLTSDEAKAFTSLIHNYNMNNNNNKNNAEMASPAATLDIFGDSNENEISIDVYFDQMKKTYYKNLVPSIILNL